MQAVALVSLSEVGFQLVCHNKADLVLSRFMLLVAAYKHGFPAATR